MAGLALTLSLGAALARDDAGAKTFFQSAMGMQQSAPQSAVSTRQSAPARKVADTRGLRMLTVRRGVYRVTYARHERAKTTRMAAKAPVPVTVEGPMQPVTIFTDKTLVRGDAVMTLKGIKVFAGSKVFPYSDIDFVALDHMTGLSKQTMSLFAAINSLPRG